MSLNIREWDGLPITIPGAISGVSMEAYHHRLVQEGQDSASRSFLWTLFDKSAAKAALRHYSRDEPEGETETASEALLLGRAAHHMILGEADFSGHFVFHPEKYPEDAVYPSMIGAMKPWTFGAKWCKAWAKDQGSREILKPRHMDAIRGMANGLYANPLVRAGVLNGHIETTLVARDPKTGIWLKIRPDAIPADGPESADLKTIADVSDEGIEKAIGETGIFLQGAMTRRVFGLLGMEFASFHPVFIEKTEPHTCRVHTLTDADLDLGDIVLDTALAVYARCLERCVWPGPGGEQTDADYAQMTPWKRRQIEHKVSLLQKEAKL